jgi:MoxR-like ATPase
LLAVIYPAMDGRRQVIMKGNGGEVIDAAPGFYVVAGHNPGVLGAVLSDALASRFSLQIQVALLTGLRPRHPAQDRPPRGARGTPTRRPAG